MKKILLIALTLLVWVDAYSQSQNTVTGKVFEDKNGNGKKDRSEKGIGEIPVSNGKDIVLTDKDGNYQLPIGNDNVIFIIKPNNYTYPVENNLNRYYYIHKPKGSPSHLKYKGVSPTGELPKSVDFALIPAVEEDKFRVLVFGDPQVTDSAEINYFSRGIISEVKNIKNVSFGIALGDLVNNILNLYKPYNEAVRESGIPWYNVLGNHDMNQDVTVDELSVETFTANFGPANYAFNHGKAHFIILDDILFPDPRGISQYWGGFRPDQLEFVANDLKYVPKDKLIVLAVHIPLYNEFGSSFDLNLRRELYNILKDYPDILVLSAHTHYQLQYFHKKSDGWEGVKPIHEYNVGTTCGDWYSGDFNELGVPISTMRDGTPKGYAFLNINDNTYTIDYKVAGKPSNYQIEIFNPKVLKADKSTRAQIFANFFMGSENDKVEFRVDDGDWKPMNYIKGEMPTYVNMVFEWDNSDTLKIGKRPSNPVLNSHLWSSQLPTKLSPGEHQIEIRATDMFGRTFKQISSYRLE